MHSLNQVNKLVSCGRDPARSLPLWRGFLLIPLILVCFAFAPQTRAVVPAPDGFYPGLNTAEGQDAMFALTTGTGNTGLGWRALFFNNADFNTAVGAAAGALNFSGTANTSVGFGALLVNNAGSRNTAAGAAALLRTAGDAEGNGSFNGAVGTQALNNNDTGFGNNAVGDSALFRNMSGAENTAVGDEALLNNDATNVGTSYNTAVGGLAMLNSITGGANTVVGAGAGPNLDTGRNNTYVGQFVGDNSGEPIDNEDFTIRIADVSADGFGSGACFIGGIWNNPQPVGDRVVVVTLNLDTDQLGFDGTASGGRAPAAPHRSAPQPRGRPQPQHPDGLNDRVGKVEKLEATVAQQQKQIETLTAQLREQAAQIQKVSAQVEMFKPAPRVVENR